MPRFSPEPSLASVRDYEECRSAIRNGSRSFYTASRLLPAAVRFPAFGLYAFCRLSDDAVDLDGGSNAALERLRNRLMRASEGRPLPHAADRTMADLLRLHAIPPAVPLSLLEGLAWDAEGRTYERLEDLFDYSVRVAGTVGVMMTLLMGVRSRRALARACDLGVAMQLTNIARDVGEDARIGRLYLPRQWLREAGVDAVEWIADPVPCDGIRSAVVRLLDTARTLYSRANAGIALLPAPCRPAILAAALIYAEIGREVERSGHDPVTWRARVSGVRKLRLLARAVAASPWLGSDGSAPPLEGARFLIDAVADGGERPRRAPSTLAGWRDSLVGVLGTFERLERVQRFGE
jgi:15-cis-phytoene synthase